MYKLNYIVFQMYYNIKLASNPVLSNSVCVSLQHNPMMHVHVDGMSKFADVHASFVLPQLSTHIITQWYTLMHKSIILIIFRCQTLFKSTVNYCSNFVPRMTYICIHGCMLLDQSKLYTHALHAPQHFTWVVQIT